MATDQHGVTNFVPVACKCLADPAEQHGLVTFPEVSEVTIYVWQHIGCMKRSVFLVTYNIVPVIKTI